MISSMLGADLFGFGGAQIDLGLITGTFFVVVLDRLVDIGQRLRLDPRARVHDKPPPSQAARLRETS